MKTATWIRWLKASILILIGATVGFALGRWTGLLRQLQLQTGIDLMDAAQLLATLIVAVYLNEFFIQRSDIDKSEKAYLLELNRECSGLLKHLQGIVRTGTPDPQTVPALVKSIHAAFLAYRDTIQACQRPISLAEAEEALQSYRRCLMLGSFPWVSLDATSLEAVEKSYRSLAAALHRSALTIIRSN